MGVLKLTYQENRSPLKVAYSKSRVKQKVAQGWFSVDPIFQPWQSPYTSMDNDPINLNDVLGDSPGKKGKEPKEEKEKGNKTLASGWFAKMLYSVFAPKYIKQAFEKADELGLKDDEYRVVTGKDENGQRFARLRYSTPEARQKAYNRYYSSEECDDNATLVILSRSITFWEGGTRQEGGAKSMSDKGISFIVGFEGFRDQPYKVTSGGNWTIGYGHEILPGEDFSDGITREQAMALKKQDVKKAEKMINKHVKVPLSQSQYDALGSYVFNAGPGGTIVRTKLIKHLNHGDYDKAVKEFDIVTSDGQVLQGLVDRRAAERNLWSNGVYK